MPALVVDSSSCIVDMNRQAETLFDCDGGEWRDRPCYDLVGGLGPGGCPFCQRDCEVMQLVRAGGETPPIQLECRSGDGHSHWLQVMSIPLPLGGVDFQVVHLFNNVDRSHRLWEHTQLIANRFSDLRGDSSVLPERLLSPREMEVLRHLTLDEDPQRIAGLLHISLATVRNHIRHILAKLGVHSIEEAVALHLLFDDEGD